MCGAIAQLLISCVFKFRRQSKIYTTQSFCVNEKNFNFFQKSALFGIYANRLRRFLLT